MSYLNVLPLEVVKTYLRIDDLQNETDAEITSIIKSALSYIEKKTNIIVYPRDKDYVVIDNCVKIYDYPINSQVTTYTVKKELKHLYSNYTISGSSVDTITFNVGYTDPLDVTDELKNAALDIISAMFYQSEANKSFQEMISATTFMFINNNRRFLI